MQSPMADQANTTDGLQKPAGMQQPKEELVIHVIPEKFYGAALKKKLPKSVPEKPAVPIPVPGAKPAVPVPGAPKKKKKTLLIVIVAVAVLLAAGAAAFFLLSGNQEPPVIAPVCGNAMCEAGESTASCPSDCPPPVPICGNTVCEEGESYTSCSADCPAPPSVCGNTVCEAGETAQSCAVDCGPPPPVCGNEQCEEGETPASCPADCRPPEPVPGIDTDSDGLTDLEERSIYQTDSRRTDTDSDGFVDLNEVLNLFDPNNAQPVPLSDNPGITVHADSALGYEIYRPTGWVLSTGPEGQTRFSAPTGEFIDVLVEDLAEGDSLADWYAALDPSVSEASLRPQLTRRGYEYLASQNRSAFFVRGGNKVFIVSYDLGGSAAIQFRVTFEMMANSLRVLPAGE